MIISFLTYYLFLGFKNLTLLFILLLITIIVMIRGTYVRIRYDQLIIIA